MSNFLFFLWQFIPVLAFPVESQNITCTKEALIFQQEWNEYFADSTRTPLEPKDYKSFEALSFFPISDGFCVLATFEPLKEKEPVYLQTTTGKERLYLKSGWLHFAIDTTSCRLAVYERPQLPGLAKADSTIQWFLPFKDITNGNQTYGGGRYMDMNGRADAGTIALNFNKSYPPLCAFSNRFSCPIVPDENQLEVEILAGVSSH